MRFRATGAPAIPALLLLVVGLLSPARSAEFRAGAAKRVITPDLERHYPIFIAGFGQNRKATAIHDDLFVRCLAVGTGGRPLVMCGVDSIGLFLDDTELIRKQAVESLGAPADIVVASLHDHEAPDTMGLWGPGPGQSGLLEEYNAHVVTMAAEAAVEAVKQMRPATPRLLTVTDPELTTFIDDSRPPVVHDPDLIVLSVSDRSGKHIATLLNWANHPEATGSSNTEISADYPAGLYRRFEQRLGGVVVLINGAVGGMQSPLGATVNDELTGGSIQKAGFRMAEIIGRRVADLACDALAKHKAAVKIGRIEFKRKQIEIPLANERFLQASQAGVFKGRKKATAEGNIATAVGLIRFWDAGKPVLEAALVPGELYPELSLGGIQRYEGADYPDAPFEPAIKKMMSAPYRMLFGLADDEIGYIIPKVEWDAEQPWLQNASKRWYGEVNSPGPETAPRITGALAELLKER